MRHESDQSPRVLVIDDDPSMQEVLKIRLSSWGYEVIVAGDAETGGELADSTSPDVVLCDVVLPGMTGIDLLQRLKQSSQTLPVILITAHGNIDDAVEAMKLGAENFLTKPIDYADLEAVLAAASETQEDRARTERLGREIKEHGDELGIIGKSQAKTELVDLVRTFAPREAPVLISGESGTGKELVARAIHEMSGRADGPFVAVNCAAVPEQLMESHFFGHEKGAFTGADRQHRGCFEQADGGTIFLDEITEMPLSLQPKLLRTLEERTLRRVGGTRDIDFDVRVVAATNHNALEAVSDGALREDLFYRLSVLPLSIPPLRARGEDVPLLAHHFVELFNSKHKTSVLGFTAASEKRLARHAWPGNVRELRNAVERAVILTNTGWIEERHLPGSIKAGPTTEAVNGIVMPDDVSIAEAERILIVRTLDQVDGNKAEAARRLGVDVKTIRNKLNRYQKEEREP